MRTSLSHDDDLAEALNSLARHFGRRFLHIVTDTPGLGAGRRCFSLC